MVFTFRWSLYQGINWFFCNFFIDFYFNSSRLIYWTNWNNDKPRIQRSDLSGRQVEDVIVKDILTPNGLTIDHKAKMLYWSDARLDKIERSDMDGTNRHVSGNLSETHLQWACTSGY